MPTDKSEQVHVVVTPERKERWQEYADEHPNTNGSLSQLIRLAVEKDNAKEQQASDGVGEEVAERLSEVLESNRQLENRLQGLEARLGSIEQAVQEDPEVNELANEIFALLPTREDIESYDDPEQGSVPPWLSEEQGGPIAYSGEVEAMVQLTDASEVTVHKALDNLQSDTELIQTTDDGRFYKKA